MRIALLITLAAGILSAAPIGDLVNTGLGTVGGVDASWTIDGKQAYVTDPAQCPFPLWKTSPGAGWVSPQPDYNRQSDDADTTFIFATTFNLPAAFLSAHIIMQIATDNALEGVMLNGIPIVFPASDVVLPGNSNATNVIGAGTGFSAGLGTPLHIFSGFQPGKNTLEFHVRNTATDTENSGNPSGMIAAFESDVVVSDSPEPASVALFGIGLAFFGSVAAVRRR